MTDLVYTRDDRGTATMSDCGRYRYALTRAIKGSLTSRPLAWLMLNPSTADAAQDDPTIRKVVGFTRRFGFGEAIVVNLFAYRARDPREVRTRLAEAEGPFTQSMILDVAKFTDRIVCAWGANRWARPRASVVLGWVAEAGLRQMCIGTTRLGGNPLHPLMPSYDGHPLVPFGGLR